MERELKFRVWDNVDYMSSPFTLHDLMFSKIEFTVDCPVMEYTSVVTTDKKFVCEEDICKAKFRNKSGDVIDLVGRVFNDDMEHYVSFETAEGEIYSCNRLHAFEIIGNTFETPHLLNSEQNVQASVATGDPQRKEP